MHLTHTEEIRDYMLVNCTVGNFAKVILEMNRGIGPVVVVKKIFKRCQNNITTLLFLLFEKGMVFHLNNIDDFWTFVIYFRYNLSLEKALELQLTKFESQLP